MPEKSAEELDNLLTNLYLDDEHGRHARGVEILQKLVRESKHAAMLEAAEIAKCKFEYRTLGSLQRMAGDSIQQSILTAAKKYEDLIMSDTPRTDAEEKLFFSSISGIQDPSRNYVPISFSRTLERELNEAKEKLKVHEMTEECSQCKQPWNPSLVESGWCIFCILKERTKERDEWKACAEELSHVVSNSYVITPSCECKACKAVTTFNQLKEKSK